MLGRSVPFKTFVLIEDLPSWPLDSYTNRTQASVTSLWVRSPCPPRYLAILRPVELILLVGTSAHRGPLISRDPRLRDVLPLPLRRDPIRSRRRGVPILMTARGGLDRPP